MVKPGLSSHNGSRTVWHFCCWSWGYLRWLTLLLLKLGVFKMVILWIGLLYWKVIRIPCCKTCSISLIFDLCLPNIVFMKGYKNRNMKMKYNRFLYLFQGLFVQILTVFYWVTMRGGGGGVLKTGYFHLWLSIFQVTLFSSSPIISFS